MILLDSIESCFENGLTAILHIRDDLLFATDEGVPAWVGLEYMGQAIAAFAGVNARQNNEPVRIGFLVSCRRYEPLVSYFSLGMSLTIRVEAVTFNTTGLRVFECSISAGKQCLVTANLNVYMPEDAGTFIRESN
ncbi:MAG: 3-hydroxylacyl-ACP dehydratase [Gammaproteobacteria bacterium]|nr:3-hydroxylacyl-ACP dehydratase [Gammaproteobacteria bacterium]